MTNDKLYKTSEVAKILKVEKKTIYKWISCDSLPVKGWFKNFGGHLRFKEWLVDRLKNGKV